MLKNQKNGLKETSLTHEKPDEEKKINSYRVKNV